MSDSLFRITLSALAAIVLISVITGIVLAAMGYYWLNADFPLLVFLTVLIGFIVLILGGCALLYFWGKSYMSKG
jgi:hypothetical protein